MKIKKGDQVKVLSGKDRDKKGKVLKVMPVAGKVVVEGVGLVKKHKKAKAQGQKSERVSLPSSVDISNIQLICPGCEKATRIGAKKIKDKKLRICKKCGVEV